MCCSYFASRKFPPTNEPLRGTNVTFYSTQRAILLATETIGEGFCCCQEEKSPCQETRLSGTKSDTAMVSWLARLEPLLSQPLSPQTPRITSIKRLPVRHFVFNYWNCRSYRARIPFESLRCLISFRVKTNGGVLLLVRIRTGWYASIFPDGYTGPHHGSERFIAFLAIEVQ